MTIKGKKLAYLAISLSLPLFQTLVARGVMKRTSGWFNYIQWLSITMDDAPTKPCALDLQA